MFLYVDRPMFEGDQLLPGGRAFVSEPRRVGLHHHVSGRFDRNVALPPDAVATGLRTSGARIWIVPEKVDDAAYLEFDDHVERWPALLAGCM